MPSLITWQQVCVLYSEIKHQWMDNGVSPGDSVSGPDIELCYAVVLFIGPWEMW